MFVKAQKHIEALLALPPNKFWGILAKRFAIASILLLVFFRLTPSLDIWITRQFFNPLLCLDANTNIKIAACLPFYGEHDGFLRFYQKLGLTSLRWGGFLLLGVTLYYAVRHGRAVFEHFHTRIILGATTSLLLGPVILTNLILKAYAGRPRPRATDIFGGDLPFMPANVWSDLCSSNCSFVSGEASGIFWCFAFLPLIGKYLGRDVGWLVFIIWSVVATTIAMNRVAFGAHYFSDVVLGAVFTLTIVCLSHWAFTPEGRQKLVQWVRSAYSHAKNQFSEKS